MSLINEMLKDLDKRKSNDQPVRKDKTGRVQRIAPAMTTQAVASKRLWIALIALIGLALVLWLTLGIWQQYRQHFDSEDVRDGQIKDLLQSRMEEPEAVDRTPLSDPNEAERTAGSVAMEALQLTQLETGLRLEFALSDATMHRLLSSGADRLILSLEDSHLSAQLPDVTPFALIESVNAMQQQSDLVFEVDFVEPVTQQSYMLKRGDKAYLVVELYPTASQQETRPAPGQPQAQSVTNADSPVTNQADPANLSDAANSANTGNPANVERAASTANANTGNAPPPVLEKTTRELSLSELDAQQAQQALTLTRNGRTAQAMAQLAEFVTRYPQAQESRIRLIALLLTNGQIKTAEEWVLEGLRSNPGSEALTKLFARVLMAQDRHPQALQMLNQFSRSEDSELLAMRASLEQRTGNHQVALELYDRLLQKQSENPQWLVGKAVSLEAMNRNEEALQIYRRAARSATIDARLKQYAQTRIDALN